MSFCNPVCRSKDKSLNYRGHLSRTSSMRKETLPSAALLVCVTLVSTLENGGQLSCQQEWVTGELVTLTFTIDKSKFPSNCEATNKRPVFLKSNDGTTRASRNCTAPDITAPTACQQSSTSVVLPACGCTAVNNSHYVVEYRFLAHPDYNGWWSADVECIDNVFQQKLDFTKVNCDNKMAKSNYQLPDCNNNTLEVVDNGQTLIGCTNIDPSHDMYWSIIYPDGVEKTVAECDSCLPDDACPDCTRKYDGYVADRNVSLSTLQFDSGSKDGATVRCAKRGRETVEVDCKMQVFNYRLPQCRSGQLDLSEVPPWTSIVCEDLRSNHNMKWTVTDKQNDVLKAASCGNKNKDYNCTSQDGFTATRENESTSELKITKNIREQANNTLTCLRGDNAAAVKCLIRVVYQAELENPSVSIDWNFTVSGRVDISKVFASDSNVTCRWYHTQRDHPQLVSSTKLSLLLFTDNDLNYQRGVCNMNMQLNTSESVYVFTVVVQPGHGPISAGTVNINSARGQIGGSLHCPDRWIEGKLVTLEFRLNISLFQHVCTDTDNSPFFVNTKSLVGKCVADNATNTCGSFAPGTLGCGCSGRRQGNYVVQYNFIALPDFNGTWSAGIICKDTSRVQQLNFPAINCDDKQVAPPVFEDDSTQPGGQPGDNTTPRGKPEDNTAPGDTKSTSSNALAIGLGGAGAVFVVIAAVGFCCFRKNRSEGRHNALPDNAPPANALPANAYLANVSPPHDLQVSGGAGPSTEKTANDALNSEVDDSSVADSDASEGTEDSCWASEAPEV